MKSTMFDRFQRSFKESVLIDELIRKEQIELHFHREGMVIGKGASSSDILRWDFSVMGAKSYVLNLSENVRRASLMDSTLTGEANLLICPNLDAANILFNVLKMTGGSGVTIGPMLLGAKAPVHVLTPSATVRRVVNMTALVAASAARA